MSETLYVIGIRWIKTKEDASKIEAALDPLGDWVRLNVYFWMIYTSSPISQIYAVIDKVLTKEDSIFVIQADPAQVSGWAPQLVVDWLAKINRGRRPTG
jgi:hypothetical protein